MERNILLTIEYDGTNYFGWQRQKDKVTVQGIIEKTLSSLCKKTVQINGTSRTDAGVHAFGQRANFSGDFGIPTEKILFATNNLLPKDIRIIEVKEMPLSFHARYDAKGKKYIYKIMNTGIESAFKRNYYYVKKPLDFQAMKEAANEIIGEHDFKSFQASGDEKKTTVRRVYSIELSKVGDEIIIEIVGDGFLYNMVRIIVGTLVDIGYGKIPKGEMIEIIKGCNREKAGHTAPPQGLYLKEVYYESMEEE